MECSVAEEDLHTETRTKFPIKSIPTLKAMVKDIQPVPIPNTIPPPAVKRPDPVTAGKKKGGPGTAIPTAPGGSMAEPMEVD
jgi:hypothetical protein